MLMLRYPDGVLWCGKCGTPECTCGTALNVIRRYREAPDTSFTAYDRAALQDWGLAQNDDPFELSGWLRMFYGHLAADMATQGKYRTTVTAPKYAYIASNLARMAAMSCLGEARYHVRCVLDTIQGVMITKGKTEEEAKELVRKTKLGRWFVSMGERAGRGQTREESVESFSNDPAEAAHIARTVHYLHTRWNGHEGGVGGALWYQGADLASRYYRGKLPDALVIDQMFDLVHNNGSLFNKVVVANDADMAWLLGWRQEATLDDMLDGCPPEILSQYGLERPFVPWEVIVIPKLREAWDASIGVEPMAMFDDRGVEAFGPALDFGVARFPPNPTTPMHHFATPYIQMWEQRTEVISKGAKNRGELVNKLVEGIGTNRRIARIDPNQYAILLPNIVEKFHKFGLRFVPGKHSTCPHAIPFVRNYGAEVCSGGVPGCACMLTSEQGNHFNRSRHGGGEEWECPYGEDCDYDSNFDSCCCHSAHHDGTCADSSTCECLACTECEQGYEDCSWQHHVANGTADECHACYHGDSCEFYGPECGWSCCIDEDEDEDEQYASVPMVGTVSATVMWTNSTANNFVIGGSA